MTKRRKRKRREKCSNSNRKLMYRKRSRKAPTNLYLYYGIFLCTMLLIFGQLSFLNEYYAISFITITKITIFVSRNKTHFKISSFFFFFNFKIFNSYMHSQTWTSLPPPLKYLVLSKIFSIYSNWKKQKLQILTFLQMSNKDL